MSLIVVFVGSLIALIGLAVIIAPSMLKKILWKLIESDRFYLIALARLVIGVLFLLAAGSTSAPLFIQIVGGFMILAGVLIPVMGRSRVRGFAEWWMNKSDLVLRLWGASALVLGVILARAGL